MVRQKLQKAKKTGERRNQLVTMNPGQDQRPQMQRSSKTPTKHALPARMQAGQWAEATAVYPSPPASQLLWAFSAMMGEAVPRQEEKRSLPSVQVQLLQPLELQGRAWLSADLQIWVCRQTGSDVSVFPAPLPWARDLDHGLDHGRARRHRHHALQPLLGRSQWAPGQRRQNSPLSQRPQAGLHCPLLLSNLISNHPSHPRFPAAVGCYQEHRVLDHDPDPVHHHVEQIHHEHLRLLGRHDAKSIALCFSIWSDSDPHRSPSSSWACE